MADDDAEPSAAMRVGHWVDNAVTTTAVVMETTKGLAPAALPPSSIVPAEDGRPTSSQVVDPTDEAAATRVAESTSHLVSNERHVQETRLAEAMEAMQADDDVLAAEHAGPPDDPASDLWAADGDEREADSSAGLWETDADVADAAMVSEPAEAWGPDVDADVGRDAGDAGGMGDIGGPGGAW